MKKIFLSFLFLQSLAVAQSFEISSNNFQDLFNNYRIGQPNTTPWSGSFFPYGDNGTAVKVLNGEPNSKGTSPMEAYDKLIGISTQTQNATQWELENHTCDKLKGEDKESCESWWGHCNGWTAAAIKETEPTHDIQVGSQTLSVADMKGIYSELWLSTNALFEGETNKSKKAGPWVMDTSYEAKSFWDVTPLSFFTIMTNYIGMQKTGIAMDRFAGDEVWNQPVVGYRILPIRAQDIQNNGKHVMIRMKIYWANDLGTLPGHVTAKFDIKRQTRDTESLERLPQSTRGEDDFDGRLLKFWLDFDEPLKMSADGLKVISAGRITTNGTWNHYLEAQKAGAHYDWLSLNSTHPDFLWLPTAPLHDNFSGYGNPFLEETKVAAIRSGNVPPQGPHENAAQTEARITIKFKLESFRFRSAITEVKVRDAIRRVLARDGIRATINFADIKLAATQATVTMTMLHGEKAAAILTLFEDAGHPLLSALDLP